MLVTKVCRCSVGYLAALVLAGLQGLGCLSGVEIARSAQTQEECTVTVRADQSVQEVIDSAGEGSVVCLAEGTWQANVKIEKALTLRGAGFDQSRVSAVLEGYPVIWITSGAQASVKVERLAISGGWGSCADPLGGICPHGVLIQGHVEAELTDNIIEGNEGCGIFSRAASEVRGQNNIMRDNGSDLCGNLSGGLRAPVAVVGFASGSEEIVVYPGADLQEAIDALLPGGKLIMHDGEYRTGVTISKPVVVEVRQAHLEGRSASAPAISLVGGGQLELVVLKELELTGGLFGLYLGNDSRAVISGSTISQNKLFGLLLADSSQATITNSVISGNGHDGILLLGQAQAAIEGSKISANGGYGVALYEQPCYETDRTFSGRVSGRGNIIPGPGETEGNAWGTVCPQALEFLMTDEGGIYPPSGGSD